MKAISSGIQTGDAAIHDDSCWYLGTTAVGDDGTDTKLVIWDNASAGSGTEVDYIQCTDENYNVCHIMKFPVWCANGIYAEADVSGEVDYIVWYAL
jgi:hypothetical protein